MSDFRILSVVAVPRKAGKSTGVFARFACDLGPVRMSGCTLAIKPDGTVAMYPPRPRAPKASVAVRDPALRAAIEEAASAAYRALGGVLPAE